MAFAATRRRRMRAVTISAPFLEVQATISAVPSRSRYRTDNDLEKAMRHPIFKKDDFFTIGKDRVEMDPNVVELPEEVALAWSFDWAGAAGPYGVVTELRVEDGEITGELRVYDPTWDDSYLDGTRSRLGGFYSGIVYNKDRTRVEKCTLKGVSIVHYPVNPGADI